MKVQICQTKCRVHQHESWSKWVGFGERGMRWPLRPQDFFYEPGHLSAFKTSQVWEVQWNQVFFQKNKSQLFCLWTEARGRQLYSRLAPQAWPSGRECHPNCQKSKSSKSQGQKMSKTLRRSDGHLFNDQRDFSRLFDRLLWATALRLNKFTYVSNRRNPVPSQS